MIEVLETLGRTLGFSLAAGVNVYATVALLGLASRYGWVELPEQFRVFDNPWIIGIAGVLYVVEFFADKIPWFDSVWDAIHTFIRPVGGALVAVAALGQASPVVAGLVALARRRGRRQQPLDQGQHPRGGQHQPRADLELDSQPRGRRRS